jgi:hypothetical protein
MSEKLNLINAIGRMVIALFTIFSKCRCASTCCKSSCMVGEETMEHEDIEIHRSRTPQPTENKPSPQLPRFIIGDNEERLPFASANEESHARELENINNSIIVV